MKISLLLLNAHNVVYDQYLYVLTIEHKSKMLCHVHRVKPIHPYLSTCSGRWMTTFYLRMRVENETTQKKMELQVVHLIGRDLGPPRKQLGES